MANRSNPDLIFVVVRYIGNAALTLGFMLSMDGDGLYCIHRLMERLREDPASIESEHIDILFSSFGHENEQRSELSDRSTNCERKDVQIVGTVFR